VPTRLSGAYYLAKPSRTWELAWLPGNEATVGANLHSTCHHGLGIAGIYSYAKPTQSYHEQVSIEYVSLYLVLCQGGATDTLAITD